MLELLYMTKPKISLGYLAKNMSVIIGIVFIWRGIWHVLDTIDHILFGGNHFWTGLLGVVIGLIILYVPDKDLKELGKL